MFCIFVIFCCDRSAYQQLFPLIFLFCHFKSWGSLSQPWRFCSSFPWLFSTWFECVSMMVILLNCVTLGMYQPCEDMDCLSDRCKILQVSRLPSCHGGALVQVTELHACFLSVYGQYLAKSLVRTSLAEKWLPIKRGEMALRSWMWG